jgi:hypothetical protein
MGRVGAPVAGEWRLLEQGARYAALGRDGVTGGRSGSEGIRLCRVGPWADHLQGSASAEGG